MQLTCTPWMQYDSTPTTVLGKYTAPDKNVFLAILHDLVSTGRHLLGV